MQFSHWLGVALAVTLALGVGLVLGGVIPLADPSPTGPDSGRDQTTRSILTNQIQPIVVNATSNGSLRVRLYQYMSQDECFRDRARTRGTAFLYDRDGRIDERYFKMPSDRATMVLYLPLNGTPPFLVAVDTNVCFDIDRSRVENVTDGYQIETRDLWERSWTRKEVTIPVGERRARAAWYPDSFSWRLWDTKFDRQNTSGARFGTLWFEDARNVTVCRKSFSATTEDECVPYFLYPGPYQVRVELDRPAARETVWSYKIATKRFTDDICSHGFTWEDLCS